MEIKPNNIYLGDAYKLIKDIPDKSIDLIYTDIPYLIENHGYGKSQLGEMNLLDIDYESEEE